VRPDRGGGARKQARLRTQRERAGAYAGHRPLPRARAARAARAARTRSGECRLHRSRDLRGARGARGFMDKTCPVSTE